jgi:mannose-6-phosphate isomerase-like protein (cupin superfamily)
MRSVTFGFDHAAMEDLVAHGGLAPIRAARVLERARGSGCRFIDLVVLPAGADIGVHTHGANDEEIYIVIDGRGQVSLDGEIVAVGPGDVMVNRPGGTHGLRNTGDVELRIVVIDIEADR